MLPFPYIHIYPSFTSFEYKKARNDGHISQMALGLLKMSCGLLLPGMCVNSTTPAAIASLTC